MKRWQRLGQVEDSEDDDSELADDESECSEPATKRLKYSSDGLSQDQPSHARSQATYQESEAQPQGAALVNQPHNSSGGIRSQKSTSVLDSVEHGSSGKSTQAVERVSNSHDDPNIARPNAAEEQARCKILAPIIVDDAVESPSSSDLSSLSERDLSPPPFLRSNRHVPTGTTPTDIDGSGDSLFRELLAGIQRSERDQMSTGRRNLRARQDKQLHPYLYDKAQYQQQWKSRGLKPVHYQIADRAAAETQDDSFSEEEDSRSINANVPSPPRSTANFDEPSLFTSITQRVEAGPYDSDGELPQTSALINRQGRRRIRSALNRPAPVVLVPYRAQSPDEYDLPPTPPSTSATHSKPQFRLPRGIVSIREEQVQHLDENRAVNISRSSSLSKQTPGRLTGARAIRIIDSSTDSEQEAADEGIRSPELEDTRIRREQKRIRGVLPASWLKIDLKAQLNKNASKTRMSGQDQSRPSGQTTKGIAQKISQRRRDAPTTPEHLSFSDTDSYNKTPVPNGEFRQSRLHVDDGQIRRLEIGDTNALDVMEVDYVDAMLAGSIRKGRTQPRKQRSVLRQPRIEESFANNQSLRSEVMRSSPNTDAESRAASRKVSRKAAPRNTKRSTRARKPQALSILDVTELESTDKIPQFLRLAVRQAQRRSDQGRHSPGRKILHLASVADTVDANHMLQLWRAGSIMPVHRPLPMENVSLVGRSDAQLIDLTVDDVEQLQRPGVENRIAGDTSHVVRHSYVRHGRLDGGRFAAGHARRSRKTQSQRRADALSRGQSVTDSPSKIIVQSEDTMPSKTKPHSRVENRLRQAQLETLEAEFARNNRALTFERRMLGLTNGLATAPSRPASFNLSLHRFLESNAESADGISPSRISPIHRNEKHVESNPENSATRSKRPRKRLSRRVGIDKEHASTLLETGAEYNELGRSATTLPESTLKVESTPVLRDLPGIQEQHSDYFDTCPFQPGKILQNSSFVGSGEFDMSLKSYEQNIAAVNNTIDPRTMASVRQWGSWTEEVASQLSSIIEQFVNRIRVVKETPPSTSDPETLVDEADATFRSIVHYLARYIKFLDPIDRQHCVNTLRSATETLADATTDYEHSQDSSRRLVSVCRRYILVIMRQAGMLAGESLVDDALRSSVALAFNEAARRMFRLCYSNGLPDLRNCRNMMLQHEQGNDDVDIHRQIEDLVVLHHCSACVETAKTKDIWELLQEHVSEVISTTESARDLEHIWRHIFTFLLISEIDAQGFYRAAYHTQECGSISSGLAVVRQILLRMFQLYPATVASITPPSRINEYFRTVLRRCHRLIAFGGWWRCESVLGAIFDFFAQRGLAQLHLEEDRGSPTFLQHHDNHNDFELQPNDRAFHIFLKILALGFTKMQTNNVYSEKKIAAILYRFIPNHGRTYLKDADLDRIDLASLRNHFDLLSTLYYISPPGRRISIQLPRYLVDLETSHREACHLSVRCWSNWTSFQASTNEGPEQLSGLTDWFASMQSSLISLHQLARSEAEQDFAAANAQAAHDFPRDLLEVTVVANQRQVVATIIDLLRGLARALRSASDMPSAIALIAGCPFWNFFFPLDLVESRMLAALHEAVEVFRTCIDVFEKFRASAVAHTTQEESQDYGDFTMLDDYVDGDVQAEKPDDIITLLLEPLGRLVSNIIGGNLSIEEGLVVKIIDVWTLLAKSDVAHDNSSWERYIQGYSSFSWSSLLETEMKRKFTPYFLARLVEVGGIDADELKTTVLTSWMTSLVDREACLKYQHRLTEAVMNSGWRDSLLVNLPFCRDVRKGQYCITLAELRQRRLSLISSLLSNMRTDYDTIQRHLPGQGADAKQRYAAMLRHIMRVMQDHYCCLSGSSRDAGSAAEAVQGVYVEFVQQVVALLQQYTTDICRVDPFFTDSSAFPLPMEDPAYVVGRLKSYVPKLGESGTRKQLAVFVQTVGERAAADGQETYLIDQLSTAMDEGIERGDMHAPSLRYVLLASIFPPYIQAAVSTPIAWIPAGPMLGASVAAVERLLREVRVGDEKSEQAVRSIVAALLASLAHLLQEAFARPDVLQLSQTCAVLRSGIEVGHASLTVCEFLSREKGVPCDVFTRLRGFRRQVQSLQRILETSWTESHATDLHAPYDENYGRKMSNDGARKLPEAMAWPDTFEFARQQVREAQNHRWHERDGRFYLRRGTLSKEVMATFGTVTEERTRLLQTCVEFEESYHVIVGRRRHAR